MPIPTDIPITPGSLLESNPLFRRQADAREFRLVNKLPRTTLPSDRELPDAAVLTGKRNPQMLFNFPIARVLLPVNANSMPMQIWEGTVVNVDHKAGIMQVVLDAKMGQVPRHTGEIDLEWVSDQDEELVRPGAVFYLTLFKRTNRGSIENSQELRFRRRPSWSETQLKRIDEDADMLISKMRALPIAE